MHPCITSVYITGLLSVKLCSVSDCIWFTVRLALIAHAAVFMSTQKDAVWVEPSCPVSIPQSVSSSLHGLRGRCINSSASYTHLPCSTIFQPCPPYSSHAHHTLATLTILQPYPPYSSHIHHTPATLTHHGVPHSSHTHPTCSTISLPTFWFTHPLSLTSASF